MIDINENLESWEIPHCVMTSYSFTSSEWAFAVDIWVNNQLPLLTCFKPSFCLLWRIFIIWMSRRLITLVGPTSITVVIIQTYKSVVCTLSTPQSPICDVSDDLRITSSNIFSKHPIAFHNMKYFFSESFL